MIWFTSDLHFSDEFISNLRGFKYINEHNTYLMANINSRVKSGDTLYILGDIGNCPKDELKFWVQRLNGNKILVRGNHEEYSNTAYYDMGFASVLESLTFKLGQKLVSAAHHPTPTSKEFARMTKIMLTRWLNKEMCLRKAIREIFNDLSNHIDYDSDIHLHGHTHLNERVDGKNINIAPEAWKLYPVSLKDVTKLTQNM